MITIKLAVIVNHDGTMKPERVKIRLNTIKELDALADTMKKERCAKEVYFVYRNTEVQCTHHCRHCGALCDVHFDDKNKQVITCRQCKKVK